MGWKWSRFRVYITSCKGLRNKTQVFVLEHTQKWRDFALEWSSARQMSKYVILYHAFPFLPLSLSPCHISLWGSTLWRSSSLQLWITQARTHTQNWIPSLRGGLPNAIHLHQGVNVGIWGSPKNIEHKTYEGQWRYIIFFYNKINKKYNKKIKILKGKKGF